MNCAAAREMISPYVDEALESVTRLELLTHLDDCRHCRAELSAIQKLRALLKELPRQALPAGFMARLETRRSPAAARVLRPALAFAAAGFVAVTVYRGSGWREPVEPRLATTGSSFTLPPPPAAPPRARPAGPSNEQVQRMLQAEAARLGITAVGKEARRIETDVDTSFLGKLGTPGTRAQAESHIRQLAAMRRAVEDSGGRPQIVPVLGRTAPLLATVDDRSRPLADWSGSDSGGQIGQLAIRDLATWKALWPTISSDPVPPVDFDKQQVVGVFIGHRPGAGYAVEIVGIAAAGGSLLVEYRERVPGPSRAPADGATSPYAMKLMPRSDLPVRFTALPPVQY